MALGQCRECRKSVSSEAATCPHCGVSKPVAPTRPVTAATSATTVGCLAIVLLYFGWCWFAPTTEERVAKQRAAQIDAMPAPPRVVEYAVAEQWSIPNGGQGKAIVIPSSAANEQSLRALGEQLKFDTRRDRNAFVFVYSDARAAAMRNNALKDLLSKADSRFFDAHFVAMYNHNGNTGFHRLSMMPKGMDGPVIEVNY